MKYTLATPNSASNSSAVCIKLFLSFIRYNHSMVTTFRSQVACYVKLDSPCCKAFDTVNRDLLYGILGRLGCPTKIRCSPPEGGFVLHIIYALSLGG